MIARLRRWLQARTPDRSLTLYDPDVAMVARMNGRRVREPHEWRVHNCRCVVVPILRFSDDPDEILAELSEYESPPEDYGPMSRLSIFSNDSPFAAAGVTPTERPTSARRSR